MAYCDTTTLEAVEKGPLWGPVIGGLRASFQGPRPVPVPQAASNMHEQLSARTLAVLDALRRSGTLTSAAMAEVYQSLFPGSSVPMAGAE